MPLKDIFFFWTIGRPKNWIRRIWNNNYKCQPWFPPYQGKHDEFYSSKNPALIIPTKSRSDSLCSFKEDVLSVRLWIVFSKRFSVVFHIAENRFDLYCFRCVKIMQDILNISLFQNLFAAIFFTRGDRILQLGGRTAIWTLFWVV